MKQPYDPDFGGKPSPASASSGCPPTHLWEEVCAGTLSEELAMNHLRHAADCSDCSDALASVLSDKTPIDIEDVTPEDEAFLASLQTSTPEGQRQLVARIAVEVEIQDAIAREQRRRNNNLKVFPRKLVWVSLTLAVAASLLVAGVILYPRLVPPSDAKLIALAYDRYRPSELRIPGAHSVELGSPTRGRGNGNASSELYEVKFRTQQEFEKNPNDPALRQTLGEIALVEHDGESARRSFEVAEALNPKLPRIKFDLGSAYFELAEKDNRPLDYARAIDLFGQYLQQVDQKDPVALFDRALCWERQSINTQAISDFEAALKLEKDAGWRAEILRHLQRLKTQSSFANPDQPQPALTPASLLALQHETPGDYENYLDLAGREWLTRRGSDPQTDAALEKLAAIGAAHQDLWLRDMLDQSQSAASQRASQAAIGALAQAWTANAHGAPDAGLAASQSSIELFRAAGLKPGLLRAQAEHIYSLQRKGQSLECIAESQAISSAPELPRYTWMHSFVNLELSSCHTQLGQNGLAEAEKVAALGMARSADLPIETLRAVGFMVATYLDRGRLDAAWATATGGLKTSYTLRNTSLRESQFFDSLQRISAAAGLDWTRAGLAEAAARASGRSENRQIAAYALETLGMRQLDIGAQTAADRSFSAADAMLLQIGDGPATDLYRADWQADRSQLLARQNRIPEALEKLAARRDAVFKQNVVSTIVPFLAEDADLLRQAHRSDESLDQAWQGIRRSEQLLSGIHSEVQRKAWQEKYSRAYLVLIRNFADTGQSAQALRAWEWFRGAAARGASVTPLPEDAASDAASLPGLPVLPAGSVTLVYARLEGAYLAWSVPSDPSLPLHMIYLTARPDSIEAEGVTFRRLCADPNSSQRDIAVLAASLHRDLLAPFADQLRSAPAVQLDLDDSLGAIPFAAIHGDTAALGLEHALAFLPAGWTVASSRNTEQSAEALPETPNILILRQTEASSSDLIPVEYDESPDIAHLFPRSRTERVSLQLAGNKLQLGGAPGLASALASAGAIDYVGHGVDSATVLESPSHSAVDLAPGSLRHCRLAVLAACNTFSSQWSEREMDSDDVPSFTRVLLRAGASHVLATQWDVDSRMTHRLMVRFYAELADHQNFAEALRRAQLSLQSEPSSAHPYFWSAFQLVSQPTASTRGRS